MRVESDLPPLRYQPYDAPLCRPDLSLAWPPSSLNLGQSSHGVFPVSRMSACPALSGLQTRLHDRYWPARCCSCPLVVARPWPGAFAAHALTCPLPGQGSASVSDMIHCWSLSDRRPRARPAAVPMLLVLLLRLPHTHTPKTYRSPSPVLHVGHPG